MYMIHNDIGLLQEAYLSITRKSKQLPSDTESITTNPNDTVSAGPVDEPAPGVSIDMTKSVEDDTAVNSTDYDTTGVPVSMSPAAGEDSRLSTEDENEEDNMAISNLSSIKDSICKIAAACAGGTHLEPWQQQKVAIAMDNLAEVARRLT